MYMYTCMCVPGMSHEFLTGAFLAWPGYHVLVHVHVHVSTVYVCTRGPHTEVQYLHTMYMYVKVGPCINFIHVPVHTCTCTCRCVHMECKHMLYLHMVKYCTCTMYKYYLKSYLHVHVPVNIQCTCVTVYICIQCTLIHYCTVLHAWITFYSMHSHFLYYLCM